jgi:DNA-binding Lrp family transcriptional regulator
MSSQVVKPQGQPHLREGLTKRQTEVLERLEFGMPVKKIAKDMGVTPAAVYQHVDKLRERGALPETYTPSGQPAGGAGEPVPVGSAVALGPALAPRESRLAELRALASDDPAYPELIEAAISSNDVAILAYELGRADAEDADDLPKRLAEAALRRLAVLPGTPVS